MNESLRAAGIVGLATVVAFFVFRGTSGGGSAAPAAPEDAVPSGAFLVASVDLDALRASPALEGLLGSDKSRALGVSGVAEACGFDPLARVKRATLSVPEEESDRGEFGVAARIEVTGEELHRCVARLAERRGGSAKTREAGSFLVLDAPTTTQPLPSPPGLHRRTTPSFAYGRGGLLLVGQGPWLEAMIRSADRKAPSTRSDPAHAALRSALGGEGWATPAVLVTMVLPRGLRDRLRAEMAAEVGASDPSAAAMGGVLGGSSAGVAVRTTEQGARLEARAELVCDDEPACVAVETLLGKKRLEWSRDLALRVVGLGALVDSVQLERTGARVHVRASTDAAALAATLNRVLRLAGGPGRLAPAAPAAPSGPPPPP